MYTIGQEVTVIGLGALKVIDSWMNDRGTERVYKLSNGRFYLEREIQRIKKAALKLSS